jgi:hypothetical protein
MSVANFALSAALERWFQTLLLLLAPELILAAESGGQALPERSLIDWFLHGLANFLLPSVTVAVGILLLTLIVWAYRGSIGEGTLGFFGIAERMIGLTKLPARHASVSFEYRDLDGKRLDLGPFIHAVARNSRGGSAVLLQDGAFLDCDPVWFTPGALVDVNVQDNLVREALVVQWDYQRNMLFVQSGYTFARLVAKIHRTPESGDAAD